ncbi:MAG: thioredoxin domain-containing protein [Fimbriimonas sp.]
MEPGVSSERQSRSGALRDWASLLLALAGMSVAGFLSASHLLQLSIPCGASSGCDIVARDPSSVFLGIPVAAFGLGCYMALAGLAMARIMGALHPLWIQVPRVLSGAGLVMSLYLITYSLLKLGVTCLWCMASGLIMLLSYAVHEWSAQVPTRRAAAPKWTFPVAFLLLSVTGAATTLQVRAAIHVAESANINRRALASMPRTELVPESAHILGNPNAPITIIEFGDLQCALCRETFRPLHKLVDSSGGRINLVYRHRPLLGMKGHEYASLLAGLSEIAAEQGKYWEFIDAVYEGQSPGKTSLNISKVLTDLGIEAKKALKRANSSTDLAYTQVKLDLAVAKKLSIVQTPTLIVTSKDVIPEAALPRTLQSVLNLPKFARLLKN